MRTLFPLIPLLLLFPAAQADTGDLVLISERPIGDRHYYEWEIEGVDSLRICAGLVDTTPGWFLLRQHHTGPWDPLFGFIPIMMNEDGVNWLALPQCIDALLIDEKDGDYYLRATYGHELIDWYGRYINIPWQYRIPVILFTGDPGASSCMSIGTQDSRSMSLDEILSEMGPRMTDSLMVPFGHFTLNLDEMIESPVLDRDSIAAMDSIWFELSCIGIYGTISEIQLAIDVHEDLDISVSERFKLNIFFNEDGCGACWLDPTIPGVFSDWIELEENDSAFITLDLYNQKDYRPVIPEEHYELADAWVQSQEISYIVFDYPSQAEFLIRAATPYGTAIEKLLIFYIMPGD